MITWSFNRSWGNLARKFRINNTEQLRHISWHCCDRRCGWGEHSGWLQHELGMSYFYAVMLSKVLKKNKFLSLWPKSQSRIVFWAFFCLLFLCYYWKPIYIPWFTDGMMERLIAYFQSIVIFLFIFYVYILFFWWYLFSVMVLGRGWGAF